MFDLVVPTTGRGSLAALLDALAAAEGARPGRIFVVDDRRDRTGPLGTGLGSEVKVLEGTGKGPAAARNVGWRASEAAWVVFLGDDVVPAGTWLSDLEVDLMSAPLDVIAVQGRVKVPVPDGRRPTEWERSLRGGRWSTADLAVRHSALEKVGGFDERLRGNSAADADLALRLQEEGGKLAAGRREVLRPVRPAPRWAGVRAQAAARDDALMAASHGRRWRGEGAPKSRHGRNLVTTACALAGLAGLGLRRPVLARAGLAGWAVGSAELAVARVLPGPRTPREACAVVASSVVLPPVAAWHWLAGRVSRRRLLRRPGPGPG